MERTLKAGIPLDVQWNDLDYMKNRNGFTLDEKNFGDLPQFVDEIHKVLRNMKEKRKENLMQ